MNIFIRYIFIGIVFLIASIILLKKGIKLKSKNICEECGNILNGEKICSKCGNPIKDNKKIKNIFLISGGICGIICLMAVVMISISILQNNNEPNAENEVYDENYTTKAYCIFDAYEYQKQNGSIEIILEGSTNNTKVSVVEKIESRNLTWEKIYKICENKKTELEQFVDSSFDYDTDTKQDTAGNTIYSYELTYEYKTKDDIKTIIADLENKDYECIMVLDENTKELNKNLIGKWVSKDEKDRYFIFNEDGTGTYSYSKNVVEDFYYSYNGIDTITYMRPYTLTLEYDRENKIIYSYEYSYTNNKAYNMAFYKE